ncbi:radical SAM protein [Sphingomonas sp. GCM10030256]|uniref:radical SAM protein n=1 Tax=Sphingomonas sp. GCM10030256 TaxID=3273427 RepID=UPI00361074DE
MATLAPPAASPFIDPAERPLPGDKFRDPQVTARGEPRATVTLGELRTLWLNTGTLCNLACASCYIESSPRNDALLYLSLQEADRFLDELTAPIEIGFTGGEPFMNPDIIAMLESALARGHRVLVLSNAMRPMRRHEAPIVGLARSFPERLTIRVSLDHHTRAVHEAERGPGTWAKALDGVAWLHANAVPLAIAGRLLPGEAEADARRAYAALFAELGLTIDALHPADLVIFPEMDASADVPEISTACWDVLGLTPAVAMCSSSRMIVHRNGMAGAEVAACTLLPYDEQFLLGRSLGEARRTVALNHPHCARFCVLGGARCSG